MIRSMRRTLCVALLASSTLAAPVLAEADAPAARAPEAAPLEEQFRDPPASARPRVWWHWMNGNITKDGIARDLDWMKRVGIGGVQTFDANLQTPQIVDHRLVYMTPEWKEAFRFAAHEADRHGLELAIAASPGWSETGGPWVQPQDGLKKLVWSETAVPPGKRFAGVLDAPPGTTGPYQSLKPALSIEEMISGHPAPPGPTYYGEVATLAVPVADSPRLVPAAAYDGAGNVLDAGLLGDADIGAGAILAQVDGAPPSLTVDYGRTVTARSATLFLPDILVPFAGAPFTAVLEASADGEAWAPVGELRLTAVPTTIGFAPVTARHFRVVLKARAMEGGLGSPVPGTALAGLFDGIAASRASQPIVVGQFALDTEARVDRFETKAGYTMSRDYLALTPPADDAVGAKPSSVIDLTDKVGADGRLDWKAPRLPKGWHWRVLRMGYSLLGTTNHPAPPEATGLEVDKFDGPAVRAYLEHYIGMYKDAAGADMVGKRGVQAILTDSIEVGEANWTPRMVEQFTKLRGYDPRRFLPALTGTLIGSRADSDKFLYDYRRTLADLLASEHYGTVAEVAHENDLIVYGEALEDRRPMLGDDMAMRKAADVPMAALWAFNEAEGPRQTLIADMKGAASVAHLYGQNLVAAESMTASMAPWAFAPKDLKRFIDLEFVTGVNRPVIHTSVHVPVEDKEPGLSLFIFGQYFNRKENWAEMARPWVDYIARSSLLLQQGRNVADVAYFYGEEAPLTGLYGDNAVADAPRDHAYDFVNFDALVNLLGNDGADVVAPSGARYRAIYLGGTSRAMTLAALRKIAALAEGGATVIGKAPTWNPSLEGAQEGPTQEWTALIERLWPDAGNSPQASSLGTPVGKGRVLASENIDAALAAIGLAADFRGKGQAGDVAIPFVHRKDEKGDIYYLSNPKASAQAFEAHFRVTGKEPELWHPETGTSERVSYRIANGETIVPLAMQAGDAVFVVFRKAAVKQEVAIAPVTRQVAANLDAGWKVDFQPERGAPASIALPRLAPLNESAQAGVKYFSGIATYSRAFAAPKGWRAGQPLWLDLGEVGALAEVRVNGQPVGAAWHAPYRLEIGKAVQQGRNTLEIRVANKWVNRLVGDAQPGAQPVTWTAMPTYRADAPLERSGLIGPVRLEVEAPAP